MKTKSLLCAFALAVTGAAAQTVVTPYIPGATVEGVTYYLPRTALRIIVTVEKQEYTPGEFCKYANMYLRLPDIKPEASTNWNIKKIWITPYGVPDPKKVYNIQLKKRTVAPLVGLSQDGILLSINTESKEDIIPEIPDNTEAEKHLNPRDYMSQETLSAGSNAKIAELTAEEIYDIRESRRALIKGEADNTPKDGAQLKLMLDQLDLQENALMQLFKGTTDTTLEVFCFDVTANELVDKMVLFRFSERLGIVDNDDLAGSPVYLSLKDLYTIPQSVEDEKVTKKKEKMEEGVYYNVPTRIAVSVFSNTKTFCKGEYAMGQFGTVEVLSNVLFDKKATTKVTFNQTNGGIKQITDGETGEN